MRFNKTIKKQIKVTFSRNLKKRNKLLTKTSRFVHSNYNVIPLFLKNELLGLNKRSISNLISNEVATASLFSHWLKIYTVNKY